MIYYLDMDRRYFLKTVLGSAFAIPIIHNQNYLSSVWGQIHYYLAQMKNLPVVVNIQALRKYSNYETMPNISILREIIIKHEISGNIIKTQRKDYGTSYTFKDFQSYKSWLNDIQSGRHLKDKVFSEFKIGYSLENKKHLIENIHFSA